MTVGWDELEDVNALVIGTLNRCTPGLGLAAIDLCPQIGGQPNTVSTRGHQR